MDDHGVSKDSLPKHQVLVDIRPASQVVKGSDASKLVYKLKKTIEFQYEIIRSKALADKASNAYVTGKSFAYNYIIPEEVLSIAKGTDSWVNIQ